MPIIEAKNLSKCYEIVKGKSSSIKELVLHKWRRSGKKEILRALDDINFSIDRGVTLGIIGANGSGKSTLLKIISGITDVTSGEIKVNGRVASLLEIGAGFHPELTGMENIYLNGSILGLSKSKIDSVLEEIISYSEIEDFIYMPVKHYSSGMLMRLGFSVAIHVDPEILVLDEVMAVGDSSFQEKSAKKIKEFKENGKTILLVTHNLDQAESMSDLILWLDSGKTRMFGTMDKAISGYMREFYNEKLKAPPMPFNLEFGSVCRSGRLGTGKVLINKVIVTDGKGKEVRKVYSGESLHIELHYEAEREGMDIESVMGIGSFDDISITRIDSTKHSKILKNVPKKGVITAILSPLLINKCGIRLSVALNPPGKPYEPYDMHLRFYEFKVESREKNPPGTVFTHPAEFEIK
jgi:ABC-type polysaccharide/polyol phosphate transport system ATPase subunit